MKKIYLILLVLVSTILLWLPFIFRIENLPGYGINFSGGMETVFANFDGPNYLIVAKSWYDKNLIRNSFSNPLPLEYYPAHLPLYPFLISLADLVMPGTWAMLFITLLGTVLAILMFYRFIEEESNSKTAWWLSLIFLFLPARWLIVRSVGSPEPWFILFVLASIYYFKKQKYWLAGMLGALAQLTKSPGILLFGGYGIYFLLEAISRKKLEWKKWFRASPILLIPGVVLPLFYFYYLKVGDFFAYFNSGDNFHLFLPPFSIFAPKGQFWTGEFWLEEIIFIWLIYGLSVIKLWQKGLRVEASFAGVFFASTLFVAHRDISRYILPIAPLALLAWQKLLSKKEIKWMAWLIIPIYLYALNFILNNTSPVGDWTPYL